MNFLSCTVAGNIARVDGTGIALDDATATLGRKAEGKLELGIRPMHLEVHGQPVDGGVPVKVKAAEDQGSFKIITVSLAGNILRARLPEGQTVPENEAWLRFPTRWTKLFADGRLVK
jgi:glycerol transport system ATP-binding protein